MTEHTAEARMKARLVGRALRLIVGAFILYSVYPVFISGNIPFLTSVAITIAALIAFYTALHFAIAAYFRSLNKWVGAVVAITPVVLVYLFVEPAGGTSAIVFIGISLIITAIRGDGGCEVMAIPALLVGRFTHLACIVFSPIDWLEEKIASLFEKSESE